jgi:hypothetical protein
MICGRFRLAEPGTRVDVWFVRRITMNHSRRTLVRAVLAVAIAVVVAGCAARTSVGQLQTNPGRYVDRNVSVSGTVTSSWGLPMVPFRMYQVNDGTGQILVLSDSNRVPSRGARVRVTGKLSEFAMIGGRSLGLHIRERSLDYRR